MKYKLGQKNNDFQWNGGVIPDWASQMIIDRSLPLRTSRPQYDEQGNYVNRYYPPNGMAHRETGDIIGTTPGWFNADTTVPAKFDTINNGIPNSAEGDLPSNIPHDYKMNNTFAGSLQKGEGFNDFASNVKIGITPSNSSSSLDYYNRNIVPVTVSSEDRAKIDAYLKTQDKTGPLQKIAHEQETLRPDQLYYGDQYDRMPYVEPQTPLNLAKATIKEIPGVINNGVHRALDLLQKGGDSLGLKPLSNEFNSAVNSLINK